MTSRLRFFMPPRQWFELLEQQAAELSLEVVYRRFDSAAHSSQVFLASLGALRGLYEEGGYRYILLSVGKVPAHDEDWGFISDSAEDIIESRGGNWSNDIVEMRTLCLGAVHSNAVGEYRKLLRSVRSVCKKGMITRGEPVSDVYYLPDTGWTYVDSLSDPESIYVPR